MWEWSQIGYLPPDSIVLSQLLPKCLGARLYILNCLLLAIIIWFGNAFIIMTINGKLRLINVIEKAII